MFEKGILVATQNLKVNVPYKFVFKYVGNGVHVKQADGKDTTDPGCSCTKPLYDPVQKELVITYTPKPIPMSIIDAGGNSMIYKNAVQIKFIEQNMPKIYVLQFQATVYD